MCPIIADGLAGHADEIRPIRAALARVKFDALTARAKIATNPEWQFDRVLVDDYTTVLHRVDAQLDGGISTSLEAARWLATLLSPGMRVVVPGPTLDGAVCAWAVDLGFYLGRTSAPGLCRLWNDPSGDAGAEPRGSHLEGVQT